MRHAKIRGVFMYSMTGYGRGEYKKDGLETTVEIKTVNNRYLDVSVKCPKIFSGQEEPIRRIVREKLTRGHADVYISVVDKRDKPKTIYLDEAVAQAYVDGAKKLKIMFPQIENDFTVTALMRIPDVIKQEESSALDEELLQSLFGALTIALDNLNAMRLVEGEKLKADMLARMDTIETLVAKIEERAPLVAKEYKKRLEEKLKKYLEDVNPDESRLLTEVAVFCDKSNIDEELTRLHSHVEQFRTICVDALVGRKLDFLVQEFNREANTVCSKSNDLRITRCGLDLKNEIEKVREQVQNVE